MKANELRIGNLLIEKHTNKIIEVIGLEKNKITFSGLFLDKWQAKPIPLTEEWLLKFGFKPNPYQDRYENEVIHVECNKTRGFTELWVDKVSHIQYVHQLQNLYFALTGEELILKQLQND